MVVGFEIYRAIFRAIRWGTPGRMGTQKVRHGESGSWRSQSPLPFRVGHWTLDQLSNSALKRLLQLAALLLLTLWVPATMGCTLERIDLWECFCCAEETAAHDEGEEQEHPHPVDCTGCTVCDALESGHFFQSQKIVKLVPFIAWLVVLQPTATCQLDPCPTPSSSVSPPVPDWLFFQRAVLSVRAPSLAS